MAHTTENIDHGVSVQDYPHWINLTNLVLVHELFLLNTPAV